jgi:hypothetical protein
MGDSGHGRIIPDWPGREAATRLRQWPTIEGLARYARARADTFAAAILVGSFAAGAADPLSDIDLILLAPDDGFAAACALRHELHGGAVLADWDQPREGLPEVAGHNWVTEDLILVETLFATPSSGFRLAEPYVVLAGELPVGVTRRPPIARSEMTGWPHAVDIAYSTLKHVLRRGPRARPS